MPRPQRKPAPSPRPDRQLIHIDGDPARKKARHAYDKARRDVDKARRALEQFHTEDQPAFDRWLHSTFGPLLTRLREIARELEEKSALIHEVEHLAFSEGISMAYAYRKVMHRRAHPEEIPEGPTPGPNEAGANPNTNEDADFPNDPFPPNSFSEEQAFNDFARTFEEFFGQKLPPGFRPPGIPPKPKTTKQVKELYRILVRKLHPDTQKQMTPQKLEWWHQVQQAYEDGDAERLEVILNLVEMEEGSPGTHTSVSMLQRITAQVKASLRELKRELNRYRHEPAWNFSRDSNHILLERRLRHDLERELHDQQQEFKEVDSILKSWAKAAESFRPRGSQKRRRGGPPQPEFPF